MLTAGTCDAMTLDWTKLRYHHTAAVRAVLMEKYSPCHNQQNAHGVEKGVAGGAQVGVNVGKRL
jgi:hypothetical protein